VGWCLCSVSQALGSGLMACNTQFAFAAFLLMEALIYFRRRKMQDWTDLPLRS
jgi:hypothetical protein